LFLIFTDNEQSFSESEKKLIIIFTSLQKLGKINKP